MLSAFATFLKRDHLPELGRKLIELAREQDLPLLKFVPGSEEALVASAGAWLEITLSRLERGEPLPTFFEPQPGWKRIASAELTLDKFQPADLLGLMNQKRLFLSFLDRFTPDVALAQSIAIALDGVFQDVLQNAFDTFARLRQEAVEREAIANEDLATANEELNAANDELSAANTSLRRQSGELLVVNERLIALERLKADFVSTVSHELRTPLTSIQGYAEFLEDGIAGALAPAQRDYVRQIEAATARLRRLVDDLLDFARLEGGSFQLNRRECDAGALVEGVVSSFAPQALAARVTLAAEVPARPLTLSADPGRIEQVLSNLAGNALKFTPAGGAITLSVAAADDATARFAVRDTGIGIAEADQARLFEKFFRADSSLTRERGGAGLGLAISKAIVSAHGGRIGVESRPNEGSTFYFELPIVRRPQEAGVC